MSNPVHRFFVYAPDRTEEGTFAKRTSVRAEHLERIMSAEFIRTGGALLTPESLSSPENQKLIGSTFICEAESLAVVREFVESDVYYKNNVWDVEKIMILPIVMAKM